MMISGVGGIRRNYLNNETDKCLYMRYMQNSVRTARVAISY